MRSLRRSKLFVPGNRPDLMRKAVNTEADSLSLDLEDAVPPEEKPNARCIVAEFLKDAKDVRQELMVRVNALETGLLFEDLYAVVSQRLSVVNLPKVESPRDIYVIDEFLSYLETKENLNHKVEIIPTLETPAGIRLSLEIGTSSNRITGLQFGAGDLCKIIGIKRETHRLIHPRTAIIYAAAEAGIQAYDSAYVKIKDLEGFERELEESKNCGFAGTSCIHPSQVSVANRVFAPTVQEISQAKRLLHAYQEACAEGRGAISFEGELVDIPIAQRAEQILEAARRFGLLES